MKVLNVNRKIKYSLCRGSMMKYGRAGFTIPEFLASCIVIVLIFMAVWAVYIFARTSWVEGYTTMKLERDASILMERMSRGMKGQGGIREAELIVAPVDGSSATAVSFNSIDDVVRGYYFSAGDNTVHFIEGAEDNAIASNVKYVTFSRNNNLITILISMEQDIRGKPLEIKLQTKVRIRN